MWNKGAVLALVLILVMTPSFALLQEGSPYVSVVGAPGGWRATPPIQVISPASLSPFVHVTNTQLYHAYGFDSLSCSLAGYPWGDAHLCGYGQAVAIVDAFDDPTLQSDMNSFTSLMGLPSCTTANGCLVKATPQGVPAPDSGWATEISLDVQWAHAIAPGAKIVLVETADNYLNNLLVGVDYAASQPGVHQVSMSWGAGEFSTESSYDTHFNVSGVSFFASSGDSGHEVEWPAASPLVVSTGGTSLFVDPSGNVLSETAWSGSGGGISAFVPEPSYQSIYGVGSGGMRGIPDVSYDSDPNTGFQIYKGGSLLQVGGTSAASPQWAALFAIVNSYRSVPISSVHFGSSAALYAAATGSANASRFRDITSGTNGACGFVCSALPGYDFVTGVGSPHADALVPYLVSNVTSPTFVPFPNVVMGTVPTPFSTNVTNPASATSNLTRVAFFVPVGWAFGGTPTPPSGWSLALNSTSIVNFTSTAGLQPGSTATFGLGLLSGQNATGNPSALVGTFATSVTDTSNPSARAGPLFLEYSIAPTNVTVTAIPNGSSYLVGSPPYTVTAALSSAQSGVPILFGVMGYSSSSNYSFTPAGGFTGSSGAVSTVFQPSGSVGDTATVVAELGTSGIVGTSLNITTLAVGLTSLAVRGTNNFLYIRTYNSSADTWGGWTILPALINDTPAATVCNEVLHIVYMGMDGNLYYGYVNQTSGVLSGWTLLDSPPNGLAASAPTLTSNATSVALVVRGLDDLIYYRFLNVTDASWTAWAVLPSGATSDSPAAAILGNTLHFAVKGMDGSTLWHASLNLTSMAFTGWDVVGGASPSSLTLTACPSLNEIVLVVRGYGDAIFLNTWSSGWAGWVGFPTGATVNGIGATVVGNSLYVALIGSDGATLWFNQWDLVSHTLSSWSAISGNTPSKPALAS